MSIDYWRLDHDGIPQRCGASDWLEACIARMASIEASNPDPFRVAYDDIGATSVSTVFLMSAGSHPVGLDGAPALFETMVFPVDDDGGALIWRTPNRDAALARHDRAVARLLQATEDGP